MFEGQRLNNLNIKKYMEISGTPIKYWIPGVPQLLQNDYGEECDCTLTSITAIIKMMRANYDTQEIYNWVEKIARAYGYKGNRGTNYLVIRTVYKKSLQGFGIKNNPVSHYLKGFCYDYELIKHELDKNQPILLNLWKDGRDYYKNHTVLIIGYYYTQDKRMLVIQDNWYRDFSYIDYDLLSIISSIQTLT